MPVVALVRHGQASFGADEYDVLSDLGHQQSRIVGAELARRSLRDPVVVSGSLARQRDTAAGIVEATGWELRELDPRWDEYDHVALVQKTLAETGADQPPHSAPHPPRSLEAPADNRSLQDLLDSALVTWIEEDAPGGWGAFRGAGTAALADLTATLASGRDAVVVSSGGTIAALCATLLDSPTASTVVALNRVAVNTAITTLLVGRGGVSLSSYNDHAHLLGGNRALLTYR